ncbi:hypothetical protein Avbf_05086 [Armadillidium vulgare]|nr:hypothetical protein Avbf_05086 [Armadillidium vulgare]
MKTLVKERHLYFWSHMMKGYCCKNSVFGNCEGVHIFFLIFYFPLFLRSIFIFFGKLFIRAVEVPPICEGKFQLLLTATIGLLV